MKNKKTIIGVFALLVLNFSAVPQRCLGAMSDTIALQGVVTANCSVVITDEPGALTLPLAITGVQHIKIATILQNCNKKTGYTLRVESANCATPVPVGAKVIDTVSTGYLPYSVEFNNPTTGGSLATIANLLATACTAATGRTVASALIVTENSTVYVNYTGSLLLAAGTYNDTLTITMNLN